MAQVDVVQNIQMIRKRILSATLRRASELPNCTPRLVAVSKTKPKEMVIAAYDAGQRNFGENYVQELVEKANDEVLLSRCPEIKWHFIGHLQRNKVNKLLTASNLHVIETVDSIKLATAIDLSWSRLMPKDNLNIFLQVNTSGEHEKSGCKPEEAPSLAAEIKAKCSHLNILGLMTIGRYDNYDVQEEINPDFKCLRDCREPVAASLGKDPHEIELSMGMSGDFEHAIEVGSTSVRVGSSIFGARNYADEK